MASEPSRDDDEFPVEDELVDMMTGALGRDLKFFSAPAVYGNRKEASYHAEPDQLARLEGECRPLPAELAAEPRHTRFMGIIPEIRRCWVSIDHQLYLWNYETGALTHYDGLDQLVVAVGVVAPRPGVFRDRIQHLLVVTTPVEVIVLAMEFEGGDVAAGDLTLHPTQFAAATDDVAIVRVVGSPEGRIFLGGADGGVYELLYTVEGSQWRSLGLGARCRTVNLSRSLLKSIVPSFFFSALSQSESGVREMAFDATRNMLFVAYTAGDVQPFSLGAGGGSFRALPEMRASALLAESHSSLSHDKGRIDLVGMDVIPLPAPRATGAAAAAGDAPCLVVTDARGTRCYLAGCDQGSSSRLRVLKVLKAPGSDLLREAQPAEPAAHDLRPPLARGSSAGQAAEPPVHTARVRHGVAVFARTAARTSSDQLVASSIEVGNPAAARELARQMDEDGSARRGVGGIGAVGQELDDVLDEREVQSVKALAEGVAMVGEGAGVGRVLALEVVQPPEWATLRVPGSRELPPPPPTPAGNKTAVPPLLAPSGLMGTLSAPAATVEAAACFAAHGPQAPALADNPLATQHGSGRAKVIALTTKGVQVFEVLSPLDRLQARLQRAQTQHGLPRALREAVLAMKQHGPVEALAQLATLASLQPDASDIVAAAAAATAAGDGHQGAHARALEVLGVFGANAHDAPRHRVLRETRERALFLSLRWRTSLALRADTNEVASQLLEAVLEQVKKAEARRRAEQRNAARARPQHAMSTAIVPSRAQVDLQRPEKPSPLVQGIVHAAARMLRPAWQWAVVVEDGTEQMLEAHARANGRRRARGGLCGCGHAGSSSGGRRHEHSASNGFASAAGAASRGTLRFRLSPAEAAALRAPVDRLVRVMNGFEQVYPRLLSLAGKHGSLAPLLASSLDGQYGTDELALAGVYRMLYRTSQALLLLQHLAQRLPQPLAQVLASREALRKDLLSLSLKDLAVAARGRAVASTLIQAVLSAGGSGRRGAVSPLASDLHKQCPFFFSLGDQLLHDAFVTLERALLPATDAASREERTHRALALFLKGATDSWPRIQRYMPSVKRACALLLRADPTHGARSAAQLALRCAVTAAAQGGLPVEESPEGDDHAGGVTGAPPTEAAAREATSVRDECYAIVIDILARGLQRSRGAAGSLMLARASASADTESDPWSDGRGEPLHVSRSAALEVLREVTTSRDARLQERLYAWFCADVERRRALALDTDLFPTANRHMVAYLSRHDQPVLLEFLASRRFSAEAAELAAEMGQEDVPPSPSLDPAAASLPAIAKRVQLLTRALDLARAAEAAGSVVPFSTSEVRDRLDIWAIQQSLFERLQGAHGTQERIAAATLRDSNSLDASSLYNDFAVRFRAFDICLELLGTCGLHEEREICACWEQLLSLPTLKSSSDLIQARRVLCDQAPPLLARYPHVVPLSWLCGELEAHAADSSDLGGRWLVDSLWRSFADHRSSIVRAYIANARAGAQRQVLPVHHLATLNTITSLWLENRSILDRPLLAQANELVTALQAVHRRVEQDSKDRGVSDSARDSLRGCKDQARHLLRQLEAAKGRYRDDDLARTAPFVGM